MDDKLFKSNALKKVHINHRHDETVIILLRIKIKSPHMIHLILNYSTKLKFLYLQLKPNFCKLIAFSFYILIKVLSVLTMSIIVFVIIEHK